MKQSTRNIIKMHGWRLDRAVHNYVYFTFYDTYVTLFKWAGRNLSRFLGWSRFTRLPFEMVFERYHSKVVTMEDASKILTLNEDVIVSPDRTERIIPYQHANKIILKEPEFIAVMDCPCRLSREDHCEPVDVCMAVGRTTAQFWLEHGQKFHAKKISQEEALTRLKEGHDRGNVTTAWFKVATGGRTGVICACCSCCCVGLFGMRLAPTLKGGESLRIINPSGYAVAVDPQRCVSCGACEEVCIFDAAARCAGGRAQEDGAACMGCGLCVERCEGGARSLVLDGTKGLPLDIDFIREELGTKGG